MVCRPNCRRGCCVAMSVSGEMASTSPRQRFAVIGGLAAESTAQVAGIPVDIRNAPVIPGALQFEDNFLRLAIVGEGDCAGRLERTDSLDFDRKVGNVPLTVPHERVTLECRLFAVFGLERSILDDQRGEAYGEIRAPGLCVGKCDA